eukprot:788052_1
MYPLQLLDFGPAPALRYALRTSASYTDEEDWNGRSSCSLLFGFDQDYFGVETAETESVAHSPGPVLSLSVTNERLVQQELNLVSVEPACFIVEKQRYVLSPGQRTDVSFEFRPQNRKTAYFGLASFKHEFGVFQINLQGVGASAEIQLLAGKSVSFEAVKRDDKRVEMIQFKNIGLLAASYSVSCPDAPFGLETSDGVGVSHLKGKIESLETVEFDVSFLGTQFEHSSDSLTLNWQ